VQEESVTPTEVFLQLLDQLPGLVNRRCMQVRYGPPDGTITRVVAEPDDVVRESLLKLMPFAEADDRVRSCRFERSLRVGTDEMLPAQPEPAVR